jgi:hypothetical protein
MQSASETQLDLVMAVGDMGQNIKFAGQLLTSNPVAARIFRAVEEGRGRASGWSIVRALGMQAEEVQPVLHSLKECGVVDSTDPGLDGYYSLTKLGFELRSGFSIAV